MADLNYDICASNGSGFDLIRFSRRFQNNYAYNICIIELRSSTTSQSLKIVYLMDDVLNLSSEFLPGLHHKHAD